METVVVRKQLLSVILLFVILVVAAVCLPYVMGHMAQKRIHQFASELSQSPELTVSIDSYQRRWFSSTAQMTLQLDGLQSFGLPPVQLQMEQQITHGPVMWNNGRLLFGLAYGRSTIVPTSATQQLLRQAAQFLMEEDWPELTIDTLIRFNRSAVIYTHLGTFSLVSPNEEATISWRGFNNETYISGDGARRDAHSAIYPLTINTPLFSVSAGDIQLTFTENQYWPENYYYHGVIQCQQFDFMDKEDDFAANLQDLSFESTASTQDGLFAGDIQFALAALKYGELHLEQAKLKLWIKGLGVKALDEIVQLASTLDLNSLDARQVRLLGLVLLPKLPALLTDKTQLQIDDLSFALPGYGRLAMTGHLRLAQKLDTSDWMTVWRDIDAKLSLSAPVAWLHEILSKRNAQVLVNEQNLQQIIAAQLAKDENAEQIVGQTPVTDLVGLDDQALAQLAEQRAQQQIDEWLGNGYLRQQGEDYRLDFVLSEGLIRLNGQIMNIFDWFS
jgi:uncharacterized protein YdgA (DUF945 family)